MAVLHYRTFGSLAIEELAPQDWTEKVHKPDIQEQWQMLYKKPGYDPL
jgi:4-oxalocrotonate tautomerase